MPGLRGLLGRLEQEEISLCNAVSASTAEQQLSQSHELALGRWALWDTPLGEQPTSIPISAGPSASPDLFNSAELSCLISLAG